MAQGTSNTNATPDVAALRKVLDCTSKPAPGGTGSVPSNNYQQGQNSGPGTMPSNSGQDKTPSQGDFDYRE